MNVLCDGCRADVAVTDLAVFMERGVQAMYCGDCAAIWSEFAKAHEAMAARFNKLLDQWDMDQRGKLPLKFTPLDFPALAATPAGALRLG